MLQSLSALLFASNIDLHKPSSVIMLSKTLAFTSLLASAFAFPEVTIKELPAGCASFPGYDAASNSAGPWSMTTAGSDNPLLVNVGLASTYSIGADRGHPYFLRGYVCLLTFTLLFRKYVY